MQQNDKDKEKNNLTISFVLYDNYEISKTNKLLKKYNKICDKKMKATNLSYDKNTISFSIGDELGFISFMPAPYPWEDLEGPCATSWLWRDASDILKNHKNHIIVYWMSKSANEIQRSIVVSQLTASVLEEVNGYGVYWGNAALINKKDVFCEMTYDIKNSGLPLFLWIDFRIEGNSDKTLNLITNGMTNFGVMEIEIIESKKSFKEIIDFVYNIANYLIKNGNVIKDGDTVGEEENQRIVANHNESVWVNDNRGKVLRINF